MNVKMPFIYNVDLAILLYFCLGIGINIKETKKVPVTLQTQ